MHRVLIVDDEAVVAETLSMIFEQHGFSTCTAYSTDEALSRASTFSPDLLLCDLNMPEKDGATLISAMDGVHPACRVLVLTGSVMGVVGIWELAEKLRKRLSVLAKPCPPSEVLAVAGALLAV